MADKIRVTVWNEFRHEQKEERIRAVYPQGIHQVIADALNADDRFTARCAWLDQDAEQGLSEEVLAATDVLFWWGHMAHQEVRDDVIDRVQKHVLGGMGLVVLHSGHMSKIFQRMLGTSCTLRWREIGEKERVWVIDPTHPIAAGLPPYFEIPHTEMYVERFDIPTPKDVVFINWYAGGDVFRGGVTFERGNGRIFYFSPGHESFPIYRDANVQRVLRNAACWAVPRAPRVELKCAKVDPLEPVAEK